MLGRAIGEVGMSRADFERSTPREIAEVFKAYDRRARNDWERARIVTTMLLQPHSKKPLRPQQVMSFTWDNESHLPAQKPMTREQHQQRVTELLKQFENGTE